MVMAIIRFGAHTNLRLESHSLNSWRSNKNTNIKKSMKTLIAAAIVFGGAILASSPVFGAVNIAPNVLYLGFQNSAAADDYIINLGAATNLVGGSTVITLSSDLTKSDITAVLGGAGTSYAGVVGVNNANNVPTVANPADAYGTELRSSNIGNPALAGSSAPTAISSSADIAAYSELGNLAAPATAGTGTLDSGKTWTGDVPSSGVPSGTYNGSTGLNPNSAVTTSSVLYEDLWYTADPDSGRTDTSKPWTYQGYFTIDLTGSSPKLTFTPTNAPATTVPKPVIVLVAKLAGTVTLISTNASPTHTYQLQYTASLSPIAWTSVGSAVTAGGTIVTNTDTTATPAQRFYQIQAQ